MKTLYVAWQNQESREWTPVARLDRENGQYKLQYTLGAKRCHGFVGLGRMSERDNVYISTELFPFFRNRLISKSRPEYRDYLRWLALEDVGDDPMEILALTAGMRATDSLELIPPPRFQDNSTVLDFFSRGFSHLHKSALERARSLDAGEKIYLMKDIQNARHDGALALRAEKDSALLGYIPKYYCRGLNRLLDVVKNDVQVEVRRVNLDAPFDMRLLCRLTAPVVEGVDLLSQENDFLPWNSPTSMPLSEIERAATALKS